MAGNERTRRQFLRLAGGGAIAAGLSRDAWAASAAGESKQGQMPHRPLGKTGEKVSVICLGGYHMGFKSQAEAARIVRAAIDAGINFLDNAWKYNNGRSEEWMGDALKGGWRDKVFLMTKSNVRDAKGAMSNLEDSLRRLKTDHLDLWQVHEIAKGDPQRVFEPGGAIEAFVRARQQGKVRFIGFTGHSDPQVHLEMLRQDFAWDTVQMPINPFDYHYKSFARLVLPEVAKRGMGAIAMKTLAFGALPRTGVVTGQECWRYALSLPVSTVCTGCESTEAVDRAVQFARTFTPLTEQEREALLSRTKDLGSQGKHESYKSARAGHCPLDGPHERFT